MSQHLGTLRRMLLLAACELVGVAEHLLAGTPAQWRAEGFVRVWPVTPVARESPSAGVGSASSG